MPRWALPLVGAIVAAASLATWALAARPASARAHTASPAPTPQPAEDPATARTRHDFAAMQRFRPGYAFWQHVFTIPDGSIAFGSAVDGRLLATFPAKGDWTRGAVWTDVSLARVLDGQPLARKVDDRRDQVAMLLERVAGPVLHNATRGNALLPNVVRYGPFLAEWGAIYERFGVPAEIGLAQVILESGLNGTRRSEANAIGFCQWLRRNWARLNHFSPVPIEAHNQTTQAPYCAAYLTILATKYGSFIPALSEHNAGGTNVGRTLISGEHLGGRDVRDRYFLGSQLARDLRALPGREYQDVYRSYGPRSYLYAEMVFGNTFNVRRLMAATAPAPVHAMRTPRAMSLAEIVTRTGLTADQLRRYNPAIVKGVPARGTLYLPTYISELGADVAFWRRPPSAAYADVLSQFLRLEPGAERWDDPASGAVLSEFQRRFKNTGTEEGEIMATVLAYAMDQAYTSERRALLLAFRSSSQIRHLVERGAYELEKLRYQPARAAFIMAKP